MKILRQSGMVFILLIVMFICTACANSNTNNNDELKEKVIQEIEYLDNTLISMLNKLNNITFQNYTVDSKKITIDEKKEENQNNGQQGDSKNSSNQGEEQTDEQNMKSDDNDIKITEMVPNTILVTDRNDIDWQAIKNQIELINSNWAIISIDFYDLIKQNTDVLEFGNLINNCIISIKNENKQESILNIAKLYSFIPKFYEKSSDINKMKNIKQIKAYLVYAYAEVETENWAQVSENLGYAETFFQNVINDIENNKANQHIVNKAYVIFKDLQNSVINKDKDLFYMKYKNLMENLNM